MKFTHRAEYPASPDVVFAALCDQEFQDAKGEATTTGTWSSDVSTSGDRTTIRSERVLPTTDLPDIAKSFVGEQLTIIEVQTWGPAGPDGSRTGDVNLHVKGAPLTLKGALRLSPKGSGTVHEVDGELKAGVPLIGGKIEQAAHAPISQAAKAETDLLRQRVS